MPSGWNVEAVLDYYGFPVNGYETSILCPFHTDHNPSCRVNTESGLFNCFSCPAQGNLLQLVVGLEDCSKTMAHIILSLISQRAVPFQGEARKKEINDSPLYKEKQREEAFAWYSRLPHKNWDLISDHYLFRRNLPSLTLHHFGVKENGNSTHPVVIPLTEQGQFVGYQIRRIDEEGRPKYKSNPGFSRKTVLEGDLQPGVVLVVEGKIDQMSAYSFGWPNTAALMGNLITEEQADKLSDIATVVISALDNDKAGEEGHEVLVDQMQQRHRRVLRFPYPNKKKDLNQLTRYEFAHNFTPLFK